MRSLLTIAAALLLTPLAFAQAVSIYGTFTPIRATNVDTGVLTTSSGYQEEYTSFWARGFGGGVTLGVLPLGPIRVGFDIRGSSKPGNNGADLALGGLKIGLKLPVLALKPYIQGSVGYLGTRTPNLSTGVTGATFNNNYLAWEILGGIDFPVVRFVDFRLIEIGGGQGIPVGVGAVQNASILTVSTGAVFHF